MPEQLRTVRISRIRVKDFATFRAVHAEAIAAQLEYGVSEVVYQSVDDPNSLTVLISGSHEAIESWLRSSERATLAGRLELDGAPETWLATELGE